MLAAALLLAVAAAEDTPLTEAAAKVMPAVVVLVTQDAAGIAEGLGTGFLISEDGTLVTNAHVIAQASRIEAMFPDGTKRAVLGVLAVDEARDVAVLKVEGTGLPFLELGKSTRVKVGTQVVVYGSPLGLSWTLSHGTISSVFDHPRAGRTLQVSGTMMGQGNSGSPVCDLDGNVLGVVFGGQGESGGIAFATPVEAIFELPRAALRPLGADTGVVVSTRTRNLILSFVSLVLVAAYLFVQHRRSLPRKLKRRIY